MKPSLPLQFKGLLATLALTTSSLAQIPIGNDSFFSATEILAERGTSPGQSLQGMTAEVGEPSHRPDQQLGDENTVWWKWTAPATGMLYLSTGLNTQYNEVSDTVMSVYSHPTTLGASFVNLSRVASNNDWSYTGFNVDYTQSRLAVPVTKNSLYYIAVDGAYDGVVSVISQRIDLTLRFVAAVPTTRRALWRWNPYQIGNAGALTVSTTSTGTYSATLQVGAVKYPFTGIFDRDGTSVRSVQPKAVTGLPRPGPITVRIDCAGSGSYSLEMDEITLGGDLPRQLTYTRTMPTPLAGLYNLGSITSPNSQPRGWIQATVSSTGGVSVTGTAADGTRFTAASFLHEVAGSTHSFYIPAFSLLHANKGQIYAPITLSQSTPGEHEMVTNAYYFRPQRTTSVFYPNGFYDAMGLIGQIYIKPLPGARALGFLNPSGGGTLILNQVGGELNANVSLGLNLAATGRATFASPGTFRPTLTLNPATGLVTGSITTTDTIAGVTKARARSLLGILFRTGGSASLTGFATGTTATTYFGVLPPAP